MNKKIIHIDSGSSRPKYRQIIDSVIHAIEKRIILKGEKIPSINQICADFSLSRDTVMLAFNEMKARGILLSQPGKGYYVASTDIRNEEKVFVLFDELNAFKEDLYNSLISNLKGKASVDLFFHHFNHKVFKNLILESEGNYTSYVIMPATFDSTCHLISNLPVDKVYILDRYKPDLSGYPVVYQDFENDFYDALVSGSDLLKKYKKLVFVNPGGKEPEQRGTGFERFCKSNGITFEVIRSLGGVKPELHEAYFLISDRDLVEMVKAAKECGYRLGENFGIVSFNDTMLKEVVADGITTISTDFVEMGKTLAGMLLSRRGEVVKNPSRLIIRKSL